MLKRNIEPNTDLFEHHSRSQEGNRRRGWTKLAASLVIVAVAISVAWIGNRYFSHLQLSRQVPTAIRQNIDFPVYLPAESKFQPDKQSFSYSQGVLFFQAGSNSTQVTFAEQRKTTDFDLAKFSTAQGLTGMKQLTINNNAVLLGKVHGLNIGIIDTGETIVTITSASNQPSSSIESIVRSIQQV